MGKSSHGESFIKLHTSATAEANDAPNADQHGKHYRKHDKRGNTGENDPRNDGADNKSYYSRKKCNKNAGNCKCAGGISARTA